MPQLGGGHVYLLKVVSSGSIILLLGILAILLLSHIPFRLQFPISPPLCVPSHPLPPALSCLRWISTQYGISSNCSKSSHLLSHYGWARELPRKKNIPKANRRTRDRLCPYSWSPPRRLSYSTVTYMQRVYVRCMLTGWWFGLCGPL